MRPSRTLAVASSLVALAWATPAEAKPRASWVKCLERCSAGKVERGGKVKIGGGGFTAGSRVIFYVKRDGRRVTRTVRAELRGSKRLIASVPRNALSGRVHVRARGGLRTKSVGPLRVAPARRDNAPATPAGTPFDGAGMWIWYVGQAGGGDPSAIATQALGNNVSTVFVKSGDGTTYWDQFSPELVAALRERGLRVCAWQYVYGDDPLAEAAVAARAKDAGAECFVIDAEIEYEGKYDQARRYVDSLRAAVGRAYPIGLAGFPYVHYHPGYPYSVFLGDGGAQFNVPQAYWRNIGEAVDQVVQTTYLVNRPYGRPIVPIGQTYGQVPPEEIQRFRALVAASGSTGLSWWAWHTTTDPQWSALGQPLGPFPGPPPSQDFVTIRQGARGDLVLWAQQHLSSAGHATGVDGDFGADTARAVGDFQAAHGLPVTGAVDTATWRKLLELVPRASKRKPDSADLKPRRNELE